MAQGGTVRYKSRFRLEQDSTKSYLGGLGDTTTDAFQDQHNSPLTFRLYLLYNICMKMKERRPICAIRMKPDILHQARVAAITHKNTLGQWLEEAILEKIKREQKREEG